MATEEPQKDSVPSDDDRLRRLEVLVDEARRRFAEDAARAATDEPTMHFAVSLLASFEQLSTTIRRYRFAKQHRSGV